jgi:putative acetyltransferase
MASSSADKRHLAYLNEPTDLMVYASQPLASVAGLSRSLQDKPSSVASVRLRPLQAEDNAAIEAVILACFKEFELEPKATAGISTLPFTEEVANMHGVFSQNGYGYWVLEDIETGFIWGGAGLAPVEALEGYAAPVCKFQRAYLLPEARGLGYGTSLATHRLRQAKRMGYQTIYLTTQQRLKAATIFKALGFKPLALETAGLKASPWCDLALVHEFGRSE